MDVFSYITGYDKYTATRVVVPKGQELAELRARYSMEEVLDSIIGHGYLLIGSGSELPLRDNMLSGEKIFAKGRAAIALIQALISNDRSQIKYPYYISQLTPLEVRIKNMQLGTIRSEGIVYVVDQTGFRNVPAGSWQYLKTGKPAQVVMKVPVLFDDFTYPIYNDHTGERLH